MTPIVKQTTRVQLYGYPLLQPFGVGIKQKTKEEVSMAYLFTLDNNVFFFFLSLRFAVFLSEVSENKLKQLNLNHEWTPEKLRQRLLTNHNNRLELQLFMLSGLPDTIFEVTELQSLKLEIINNVTIPASIAQLENLQELSLYQCCLKIHTTATSFLKEKLKVCFSGSEFGVACYFIFLDFVFCFCLVQYVGQHSGSNHPVYHVVYTIVISVVFYGL